MNSYSQTERILVVINDSTFYPETTNELKGLTLDYIEFNNFKTLPSLKDIESIKRITISHHGLTDLPKDIFRFEMLESITIAYGKLKRLEGDFSNFKNLTDIQLLHNDITQLTKDELRLPNKLEKLNLSNNPIKILDPELFVSMTDIKKVYVNTPGIGCLLTEQQKQQLLDTSPNCVFWFGDRPTMKNE